MRQQETVLVPRDPEAVFAFLADPRNLPAWLERVEEVELHDAPGEGAAFRQRVGGEAAEPAWFDGRITRCAHAEAVAFRVETPENPVEVAFALEDDQAGTRVEQTVEMPLESWARKVLAPVVWLVNRRRMRDQLDRLRATLEGQVPREGSR